MSDHNKKVEPLRFDPASSATPKPVPEKTVPDVSAGSRANTNAKWVLPALSGLVVVALLVFFWLPRQVDPGAVELAQPEPPQSAAGGQGTGSRSTEERSPYLDAQLARERKDAQAILEQLLEVQFALEEIGIEQWNPEGFAAAQSKAEAADALYREQAFIDAAARYQEALDDMVALQEIAETVFQDQLELGLAALRSDQAAPALAALELAILIKPDDPDALAALARAQTLEPVLDLMQQASDASAAGDLKSAIAQLEEAVALDPEHPGAQAQLVATRRDLAKRNFNQAMSDGYLALDAGDYDDAERQFKAAQSILPAAAEPDTALAETRIARTQAQIEAWRRRAEDAEQREDWNRALAAYKEILDIDRSVVVARSGLLRAKSRAQLDQRLKQALASPDRLSNDAVYRDTQALYQQALAQETKGPLLREQLGQLDTLLKQAAIPVPVLLQSDEQTEVTVLKVARLGSFRRQQLSLKPGLYTAVGVRRGYRDVRQQFRVQAATEQAQVIEVVCTEPI
ncbi:MAG: hypothetical protein AAGI24_08180 [Pseudomonadota bacterium]